MLIALPPMLYATVLVLTALMATSCDFSSRESLRCLEKSSRSSPPQTLSASARAAHDSLYPRHEIPLSQAQIISSNIYGGGTPNVNGTVFVITFDGRTERCVWNQRYIENPDGEDTQRLESNCQQTEQLTSEQHKELIAALAGSGIASGVWRFLPEQAMWPSSSSELKFRREPGEPFGALSIMSSAGPECANRLQTRISELLKQ